MESNRPITFLSSTFEDLKEHRKLIIEIFNKFQIIPSAMEFFGSKHGNPIEECINAVKKADIFILIIGTRYGIAQYNNKSITEIEYETAMNNELQIYAYLIDEEKHTVLPKNVDTDENRSKLLSFRSRIKNEHTVTKFISPEQLALSIATDMVGIIASIDIDQKVQEMINKQQEISLFVQGAGYSADRRPASVSIEHDLKTGNTRFKDGLTALYLANKFAEGNFRILKGYLTFNFSTWNLFIQLLKVFTVDSTKLSEEINRTFDLDYIRLLIIIVGDLSLSECAESVCIAARSVNAHREMMSLNKKYQHIAIPFFHVVTNALSKMNDLDRNVLKVQMEKAKLGQRWHSYNAFKKAEKNLNSA